jgi:pimeloyl-ACP methyl ester carboxylesterase
LISIVRAIGRSCYFSDVDGNVREARGVEHQPHAAGESFMAWSTVHTLIASAALAFIGCGPTTVVAAQTTQQQQLKPVDKGYAEAAEGLRVYYEIYGRGEPIVVMAGGFGNTTSMAQTIGPLSRQRQVIGIDLEGHGRTALRKTPMSHERNGDDVAAVLRHLKIAKADVAGYSHGGDAAIRMAIQHPEMVRNLIVIATAAERDGWYPENLQGMEAVSSAQAKQMQQTPLYQQYYAPVAPHPEQFPQLLDRMGELMRKDYDWRPEIRNLRVPTLLVFADHDGVSMRHIAEFFALFDGGVRDAGWGDKPKYARARLAIVPGYTHYNLGMGPDVARVIEEYLRHPTSRATQFAPE